VEPAEIADSDHGGAHHLHGPDHTQSAQLRFLRVTLTIAPVNPGRHARWLLAAIAFGALFLPFLVYLTGTITLGPYANGGPLAFLADYYADLARLRGAAWGLLLGPVALVAAWRLLRALSGRVSTDAVTRGSTSTTRPG
jgi:hypothetical protein